MNIFSRYLNQWSSNRDFDQFIAYWDRLEYLVVSVYRQKMSAKAAEVEFGTVWSWLGENYQRWAAELRPFWQQTRAAGKPTTIDPFQLLLDLQSPAQINDNWHLMQHLPAAREAINLFLRDQ